MEIRKHTSTIFELTAWTKYLFTCNVILLIIIASLIAYLMLQRKIIIVQIPNGGGTVVESTLESNSIDRGSQKAVVLAVVSALSQINPANFEYEKSFIQSFLAPEAFTALSNQIDVQVRRMTEQRELGSFYFDFKEYQYDPILNKHFVKGDIHTVNIVRNSAQSWVFELSLRVENYRPMVTNLIAYAGNEFHNSNWLSNSKKNDL